MRSKLIIIALQEKTFLDRCILGWNPGTKWSKDFKARLNEKLKEDLVSELKKLKFLEAKHYNYKKVSGKSYILCYKKATFDTLFENKNFHSFSLSSRTLYYSARSPAFGQIYEQYGGFASVSSIEFNSNKL